MKKRTGENETLRCSFCNKDQNDVRKLIALGESFNGRQRHFAAFVIQKVSDSLYTRRG